jgi:hypothetical protein
MRRYLPVILLLGALVWAGTSLVSGECEVVHPGNCFWGFVIDDPTGDSLSGMTVRLYPPVGFTELAQTNECGEYWFYRPLGQQGGPPGWDPGWYTIVVGCCEKRIYRDGDGDIHQDFTVPCNCE